MKDIKYGDRNKRKPRGRPGPRVSPENKKDVHVQFLLTNIQGEKFLKDYAIRTDGSIGITAGRVFELMLEQGRWKEINGRLYVEFPTGKMAEDSA